MSDYLGNLMARSWNAAGTVRPRLATAFEPPKPLPGLTAEAVPNLETEQFVERAAPAPVAPPSLNARAAEPRRQNPAEPFPAASRTESEPPSPPPAAPPSGPLRRDASPSVLPKPEIGQSGEASLAERTLERPTPLRLADPEPAPALSPRERQVPASVVPERENRTDREALPVTPAGVRRDAPVREPSFDKEFGREEGARISPPNRAVASMRRADATGPSVPRQSAAESSPIQVTIGRIEVRAVTPAPPSRPAPPPKSPVPSLADYLRERNGGTR